MVCVQKVRGLRAEICSSGAAEEDFAKLCQWVMIESAEPVAGFLM